MKIVHHHYWFILPAIQFQPPFQLASFKVGWSVVIWWGTLGVSFGGVWTKEIL